MFGLCRRKGFLNILSLLGMLLLGWVNVAGAQEFPSKDLRMIVPYPPGGQVDVGARALADSMSRSLGRPVVIYNQPGGGGVPAVLELKRAEPDGHTMILMDVSLWAAFPAVRPDAPFDPLKDLAPVGHAYNHDVLLFTYSASPAKDIKGLVEIGKTKRLTYATVGLGGIIHFVGEALRVATGANFEAVAYRGGADAMLAVLREEVDFGIIQWGRVAGQVQNGKLRALAVSMPTRLPSAPDVPTLAETVAPGYDFAGSVGLATTAGTPSANIGKLSAAMLQAMKTQVMIDAAKKWDLILAPSSPEEFGEIIRHDVARFAEVARKANIKLQ